MTFGPDSYRNATDETMNNDEVSTKLQSSSLVDPEKSVDDKYEEAVDLSAKYEKVCGVLLKRDAKPVVLLPLIGLYFTNCCAGVFVSAWVVFLLRDPTLGNVPADQLGRVTSTTLLF